MRPLVLIPALIFFAVTGFLFTQLMFGGDPSRVPTALQDKPVPDFTLAALEGLSGDDGIIPGFDTQSLQTGELTLVNVWASWCIPCRDEHPFIEQLAQDGRFRVFGLNYKDTGENARRFLNRYGNPFHAVGVDPRGRVGIDWGVYGVPETFIVSGDGVILYKYVGPINQAILDEVLMPEIEKALAVTPVS